MSEALGIDEDAWGLWEVNSEWHCALVDRGSLVLARGGGVVRAPGAVGGQHRVARQWPQPWESLAERRGMVSCSALTGG